MTEENAHEERGMLDDGEKDPRPQQVNWWGILGLLCVVVSAYLSVRIITEILSLLGKNP